MSAEELQVGFVGNPNCGKTTLFNAYTGAKLKVANWPGVTVEKKEGALKIPQSHVQAGGPSRYLQPDVLYNGRKAVQGIYTSG